MSAARNYDKRAIAVTRVIKNKNAVISLTFDHLNIPTMAVPANPPATPPMIPPTMP